MEKYEPKPGAYILQKDGTLAPDLSDEAMAARVGQVPAFHVTDTSLEQKEEVADVKK